MGRLFAGTPWDRIPTCDRCGSIETECKCPTPTIEPKRIPPENQTARVRVEKRAKGKVATVISNLDPVGTGLAELATRLKTACGSGGTVKDEAIEIQGNHVSTVDRILREIGFKTKLG